MVPAPTYSGVFDASQSPLVNVCELSGNTCGATVASFSGSAIKLDLEREAYSATWKTKGAGLNPSKTYRISVLIGTSALGYADVVVLSNGSQIKTVDKNQFGATINGGVLNIRFRIEQSAPPPPPPPVNWRSGDVITFHQTAWGIHGVDISVLSHHFNVVYPTTEVEVGTPGSGGFSMAFSSGGAVGAYLPASGAAAPLNADLIDPFPARLARSAVRCSRWR